MDFFKDCQFAHSRLVCIDKGGLVLAVLEEGLGGVQLGGVVMAHDLAEVAMLVSETAAISMIAIFVREEGATILCIVQAVFVKLVIFD